MLINAKVILFFKQDCNITKKMNYKINSKFDNNIFLQILANLEHIQENVFRISNSRAAFSFQKMFVAAKSHM